MGSLDTRRALLVGVGGLGSIAGRVLARVGGLRLRLVDDDTVEVSNLHRQLLFGESDIGRAKLGAAMESLRREGSGRGGVEVEGFEGRFVPDTAASLLEGVDLIVEGADNMATKFLVADAAFLGRIPAVQAGAVRWRGWAMATVPKQGPCLRCVFEDLPRDRAETCAEAGVVGPVVGVLGSIQAALAIRALAGDSSVAGELWSFDGVTGELRRRRVRKRAECSLCEGHIVDLSPERYAAPCG